MYNLISKKMENNLKNQLKNADDRELASIVNNLTEQIRSGRYRKVEVQRDVVTVLAQRKPRVNSVTREAYQAFVKNVCSAAAKNQDVVRRARSFAKDNRLDC